jgi:hypothetical protein
LVRCALETDEQSAAEQCLDDVRRLQEVLGTARDKYGWELGETCITHCEALVSRIKKANATSGDHGNAVDAEQSLDLGIDNAHVNPFGSDFWGSADFMNTMPWDPLNSQFEFNEFF